MTRLCVVTASAGWLLAVISACSTPPKLEPAIGAEALSDEFDGPRVSPDWTILNGETFAHGIEGGELFIQPNRNVVWWKQDNGPMLYKTVEGNFRVSTRVRARSVARPDEPPSIDYQFGGLIARNPASDESGKENYVFSVVGYRGDYLSAETKSTRNDSSAVKGPKWPSGDAELRICRVHHELILLDRAIGADQWNRAITYSRADLPATLQVGPIAYTYGDHWDLRARFDYVTFGAVSSEADCYAD